MYLVRSLRHKAFIAVICLAFITSLIATINTEFRASAAVTQSPAPTSVWRNVDAPRDAPIRSLAYTQGKLMAASSQDIWVSNDNGLTWQIRLISEKLDEG